jgi:hypothetical protein
MKVPSYKRVRAFKTDDSNYYLIVYRMDYAYGRPLTGEVLPLDYLQFTIYSNIYSFANKFFRLIGK